MDICGGTMAAMTMEGWEKSHEEMMNRVNVDDFRFYEMSSEELHQCIEEDWAAYPSDSPWLTNKYYADQQAPDLILNFSEDSDSYLNDPILPEALSIIVNPKTGLRVTDPDWPKIYYNHLFNPDPPPSEQIKPYHPTLDHDYLKMIPEEDEEVKEKIEVETDVDVWQIDQFSDEQVSAPLRIPEKLPAYRQVAKKETKRSSKRTADVRRREQARKISNAVHAVLNIKKPGNVRQYRNTKLKNSVETTPSQSDIEEWHSQPVRPTYTKITKKKTSKGRIDHSESERHRREVLRRNFHSLSDLIPVDFLRGEKASSQISKQKILNGAKSFIKEMLKAKCSYRALRAEFDTLEERWQKRNSSKLSRCLKRQK